MSEAWHVLGRDVRDERVMSVRLLELAIATDGHVIEARLFLGPSVALDDVEHDAAFARVR